MTNVECRMSNVEVMNSVYTHCLSINIQWNLSTSLDKQGIFFYKTFTDNDSYLKIAKPIRLHKLLI